MFIQTNYFFLINFESQFFNGEDNNNVTQIHEPLCPCQFQMMIKQDRFGTMF